jgi:glucokinase
MRLAMRLGIDVGGSKLAFALAEPRAGRLVASRRLAWTPSGDAERDLAVIVAGARDLLGETEVPTGALEAVGVCAPGPLDADAGIVQGPPNLPGWQEVLLVRHLEQELGCPVALENDANAAALAEWRARRGRGVASLVYLTLSTGVGAGLVLDGHLHRGAQGLAGELGHVPVVWDGEPCACGQRGCLEAYVGGAAWTRRLRSLAPEESRVVSLAGTRSQVTPVHVVEAARAGDAFALRELERWNEHLARALVAIAFSLAPEVIVLGTIATAAGEALCLAPLRERLAARLWPRLAAASQLELSALGEMLPFHAGLAVAERAARSNS